MNKVSWDNYNKTVKTETIVEAKAETLAEAYAEAHGTLIALVKTLEDHLESYSEDISKSLKEAEKGDNYDIIDPLKLTLKFMEKDFDKIKKDTVKAQKFIDDYHPKSDEK